MATDIATPIKTQSKTEKPYRRDRNGGIAFTVLCCVIFNEFLVDPMPPVMASPNFSEDKAAGD
jgi:hypothetical protein